MTKTKQQWLARACALALAANTLPAFAQNGAQNGGQTATPQAEPRQQHTEAITIETGTPQVFIRQRGGAPSVQPFHQAFQWNGTGGNVFQFNHSGQDAVFIATPQGGSGAATFMSFEMGTGRVVKGAPYSAESVTEFVQVLADGNRIERRHSNNTYRDGQGRTRRDHQLPPLGINEGPSTTPAVSFITDPVENTIYSIDHKNKTARRSKLPAPNTAGAIAFHTMNENNVFITPGMPLPPTPPGTPQQRIEIVSADGKSSVITRRVQTGDSSLLQNLAVTKVQPLYPTAAKAAKAQGVVKVKLTVGNAGEVVSAEAVDGHPLLRDAAVEAARQWKFKPLTLSGEAVKTEGVITFNFTLQDNERAFDSGLELRTEATRTMKIDAGNSASGPTRIPLTPPKVEALGKQTIEGVECDGTRRTTTIPAGTFGNVQPIEIVAETWYSPALQVMMLHKQSDPRTGTTTTRLTNLLRAEPDANLFKVPSDYTVKDEPVGFRIEERRITTTTTKQEN